MRKYFGTDGVRGPFGGPVINREFAARLGAAAGQWGGGGRVLIGRDTRQSGPELLSGLVDGLTSVGASVIDLGVVPTPAVAREVRESGADLGVVITASHNPASDNGIKFFGPGGIKLTDTDELAIEGLLLDQIPTRNEQRIGSADARGNYITAMASMLPAGALAGWSIVIDTANGATVSTSPEVLRQLGADLVGLGNQPNGTNINAGVGSEHPEELALEVTRQGAKLGVAHDGDGDRCILCDEKGDVLDGDEIMTILALHAMKNDALAANTLVVTQQSNLGIDAAIKAAGGKVVRTNIGDRYVAERMRADGAGLGGESSGHIICDEVGPTGDGLGAALRVIAVMHETGKPLSELRLGLEKFPQRSGTVKVSRKPPLSECVALSAAMAEIENEFGETGRILVRFSGTEPKLRLLVEGPSIAKVDEVYQRLDAAARSDLVEA